MEPIEHFRYCPSCGKPLAIHADTQRAVAQAPARLSARPAVIHCEECGFLYHFNPTVAAGAILTRPDGAALFVRRARDPEKGKLALPGGFIEIGETAEVSLRREILEEVGIEIGELAFLCSEVNAYEYREVRYPVLDLFFKATVSQAVKPQALDDVDEVCWIDPCRVDTAQLAFPSVRAAVRYFATQITASGKIPGSQTTPASPQVPAEPPPGNRNGR
jgi:ADP-ribose pyrophosphatase YjhB (NUDIX family)